MTASASVQQKARKPRESTQAAPKRCQHSSSSAHTSVERAPADNFALQAYLRAHAIQPKLEIGPPDDHYDREADRIADQVMRAPATQSGPGNSHKYVGCRRGNTDPRACYRHTDRTASLHLAEVQSGSSQPVFTEHRRVSTVSAYQDIETNALHSEFSDLRGVRSPPTAKST